MSIINNMAQTDPFEALKETFGEIDNQQQELAAEESVLQVELSAAEATIEGLKRQLANKKSETSILESQLITANTNFVRSLPELGELAMAVFHLKLPKNTEEIQSNPHELLKIFSGIHQYWERLIGLESKFADTDEPIPVMTTSFRDLRLAEGGNADGPMRHQDIRAVSLTLGVVPPRAKFAIEYETHEVAHGMASYDLPVAVSLAINNSLSIGTQAGSWSYSYGEDTWLEEPHPTYEETTRLDILRRRRHELNTLEMLPTETMKTRANHPQLVVGKGNIASALEHIKAAHGVDDSPLYYVSKYLNGLGNTL